VTRQKISKTNDFAQAGERYRSLGKIDQEHLVDNLIADLMHIDLKAIINSIGNARENSIVTSIK